MILGKVLILNLLHEKLSVLNYLKFNKKNNQPNMSGNLIL